MARAIRKPKEKISRRFGWSFGRFGHSRKGLSSASLGEKKSTLTKQHFFESRIFVIVLIGIVGLLLVSVTRETIRRVQIAREIQRVQDTVLLQEDRNAQMNLLTSVLNTSVAQEKQSRLTLNSIIPGEKVVIIQSESDDADSGAIADQIVLPNGETIDIIEEAQSSSNPEKWFNYFFRNI